MSLIRFKPCEPWGRRMARWNCCGRQQGCFGVGSSETFGTWSEICLDDKDSWWVEGYIMMIHCIFLDRLKICRWTVIKITPSNVDVNESIGLKIGSVIPVDAHNLKPILLWNLWMGWPVESMPRTSIPQSSWPRVPVAVCGKLKFCFWPRVRSAVSWC